MAKAEAHEWELEARFRRHAFDWKSQPAIQRVKQAASEIETVGRAHPVLAAEGAVVFIERILPALEHVDGSSGAIGTAANNALAGLVPIVAGAPADARTRDAWLERLWQAHEAGRIPYVGQLGDHRGELCASKGRVSRWADRLVGITRMALSPDPKRLRDHRRRRLGGVLEHTEGRREERDSSRRPRASREHGRRAAGRVRRADPRTGARSVKERAHPRRRTEGRGQDGVRARRERRRRERSGARSLRLNPGAVRPSRSARRGRPSRASGAAHERPRAHVGLDGSPLRMVS